MVFLQKHSPNTQDQRAEVWPSSGRWAELDSPGDPEFVPFLPPPTPPTLMPGESAEHNLATSKLASLTPLGKRMTGWKASLLICSSSRIAHLGASLGGLASGCHSLRMSTTLHGSFFSFLAAEGWCLFSVYFQKII